MGSTSGPKLPLIDLSDLRHCEPGTTSWDSIQVAVAQALEEYGCFEGLFDKITMDLHDNVFQELEKLFNLPAETKCRFIIPDKPFNGYLANIPPNPLHESMGIDELDSGIIRRLADLMWPEGNPGFSETLNSYLSGLRELDSMIKKVVFRSLGVEKYLDSHVQATGYSLRLMKYGAPETVEPKRGSITHYDINFVTILQQNHINGLEVQTKNDDWIKVTPSSSSCVVMVGEAFHGWSNGRLYCPRHRVMMSGSLARYSIGLFSNVEGQVKCPEELVDDQHPLLFKPFDKTGLVRIYVTEEGQNGASALRTFYSA